MTKINLKVSGASAIATLDGILTSGMIGIPVSIEYNQEWSGLSKTCVFRVGSFQRDRKNIANETTVPWEVMRHYGKVLEIGVEGRNDAGDIVIPTVWAKVATIKQGANATVPGAPDPEQGEEPSGNAIIDDSVIVSNRVWSSKNTVDKLCPSFTESGGVAVCDPVDGYPLEVISTINEKDDGTYESISLTRCGKNLFDFKQPVSLVTYATSTGQGSRYGYSFILPAGTYTMHAEPIGTVKDQYIYCVLNDLSGKIVTVDGFGYIKQGTKYYTRTFTLTEPTRLYVYNGSSSGTQAVTDAIFHNDHNVQIEAGGVSTAYEPYNGQTLTADFTNAPGMEGKGDYNWNTGLLHNGASAYLHDPVTGAFTMINDEDASEILRNIPALPGTNYIYSDCGNTEVKGKADPVKTIEKLTNAILALGGTV